MRWAAGLALVLGVAVLLGARSGETSVTTTYALGPARDAACRPTELKRRRAALAAYKRTLLTKRRTYFRTHPKTKDRRAYLRREQSKLQALERAVAACAKTPPPPAPPPPAPPPVPPPTAPPPSLPPSSSGPACSPELRPAEVSTDVRSYFHEGPTDLAFFARPVGELRVVVLFVEFPDALAPRTTHDVLANLSPDPAAWYAEVSYGRLRVELAAVHKWYRLPGSFATYGAPARFGDRARPLFEDAIRAADAEVDFSAYDALYVVPSVPATSPGAAAHLVFARPGTADVGLQADGKEFKHAVASGIEVRGSVLVHELGHVLGLPDLYDWSSSGPDQNRFTGGWDTMGAVAQGRHFLAWQKHKLGWLDPLQLRCLTAPGQLEETLRPLETPGGVKAIVAQTGPSTAYAVEVRRRLMQDAPLCDTGVLLYTVDSTTRSGEGPIRVKAAQAGADPLLLGRCGPLYDAPFDLGPGEVSSYEDGAIRLELLATDGSAYRVRVTQK